MTDTATPPVDTAALAAKDDTNVPSVGDHLAAAQAAVTEQPAPATDPLTEAPPDIPSQREADLQRRVTALEERLRYFTDRREKEQHLLSQRDSALAAIEGAKARVQSCKGELAEVEEEIAALLKEPMPMAFEATPIGQMVADAKGELAPVVPPPTPWESILPAVPADSVRLIDATAGDELPTVDALCGALLAPQAMMGGKRVVKQSVQVYGTPWIVTHLWKDEASGACRANVVRLYTKDEYQQTHEAKYGRAVGDFDQSDEAKAQRQVGGEWCGLVVKVSRRVYVVGPQADALHLAYLPPEPAAELTGQALERAQDAAERADELNARDAGDEPWPDVAKRAMEIIEATGMTAAAYSLQYKLPYLALSKLLATGVGPDDASTANVLRVAFPPYEDEDAGVNEDGDDQHMGPGIPN
jgi:hypothetical protein